MKRRAQDLGVRKAGDIVTVTIKGTEINLVLLDQLNRDRYMRLGSCSYVGGGHYKRSPAVITIPAPGHWFLGIDFGGYTGSATYELTVTPPRKRAAVKRAAPKES